MSNFEKLIIYFVFIGLFVMLMVTSNRAIKHKKMIIEQGVIIEQNETKINKSVSQNKTNINIIAQIFSDGLQKLTITMKTNPKTYTYNDIAETEITLEKFNKILNKD